MTQDPIIHVFANEMAWGHSNTKTDGVCANACRGDMGEKHIEPHNDAFQ